MRTMKPSSRGDIESFPQAVTAITSSYFTDYAVRPGRYIYVSIDTDVLDLAIIPGTTIPEPEGISYQLLRRALWQVCAKGRIVGFDVVELSPPHDVGGVSARVTSWILTHFLSAITATQE